MAKLDLSVDPKTEFDRKLVEPHDAVALVESGDLVWMPSAHQPPAIGMFISPFMDHVTRVFLPTAS